MMGGRAFRVALVCGVACAVWAAPAAAETVSAIGTAQVRVDPNDPRDNDSIKAAIDQARATVLPLALADARARAQELAAGSGLTLGNVESVEEYQDGRFAYPGETTGTFGPGRFCGTRTRSVRRRLSDGRIVRRRVRQRRCFFPPVLAASVEVTYTASRSGG
jgi:hypothetical protein